MYRSKHQKGYKTSHEVQTTHFRTWKSGKKWLYGATSFMLLAGGIEPAFTPLMLKTVVHAATTSTALNQGTSIKTPDVVPYYTGLTSASGAAAFTASGNTTIKTTGNNTSANWNSGTLQLHDDSALSGQKGNAWATFNPTLNMQQPVSFSGSIKSVPNSILNAANQVGQYLGMYFVPVGTSFSNTSLSGGKTTTAITGVPNGVFLGRNYWYNGNASNTIQVSQTNASTTQTDVGTVDNFAVSSSGESFSVTWTPTSVGATTTMGTITLSVNNGTTTQTVTGTVTMQNAMQVGFGGGTGNYGSAMTVYNVKQTNNGFDGFSAYQPTGQVNVNYLNTKTSTSMAPKGSTWASTAVTANLGDTIGILAPSGAVDSATYDYMVSVAPSGYTFSAVSGSPTTVAASSAVVNAYYTPNSQSATFNYSLATGTASAAWGATSSVAPSVTSGYTDGAIAAPSVTSAASGYTTSYVYNNSSYSTLISAESAYASQYSAVAGTFAGASPNPTFTLVASANSQSVTTTTAWTASNTPGASSAAAMGSLQASLPSAVQYSSATGVTTGTVLSGLDYWNSMGRTPANIPAGYNIATINYNGYTLSQAYTTSGAATSMYLMSGASVLASSAGSNLASYAYSAISSSAQPAMVSAFTVPASSTEMDFTYAANSTAQGEIYLKTQTASGASLTSGASSSGGTKYNYYAPNSTYNAATAPTSAGFSNTQNTWRVTTGEYYNSYAVFPTDASLAVKGYSYSVLVLTSGGATSAFAPTDAMWSSAAAAGASGSLLSGSAGSTTALSGYDFTTMASATSLATVAYNTTAGNSTGKVANFAVVYTPLAPTVNTKNTLLAVGSSWKRPDNISSVTDGNGTSTDSNYINQQINATVTGPNGYSGTTVQTNVPGTYTITYTYTDPVNGATTTKTATVTVVGAYGFNTSVGLDQGLTGAEINQSFGENSYASPNDVNVIADNTPFTSLATGATVTNATVSNLQFTDNNGDSATPNLQESDITVTNAGEVEIASGKLNQSGTYSFLVTYTYTNSAGQTVSVSTTDTINVVPPFELPFTGGSGNQFLYLMISLAAIGALGLYFSKRRKEEELEFVPEQADYGVSTPNKGKKARFLHTLRKTRPYRKVFHSKNRIHLAQTQRKEGKK